MRGGGRRKIVQSKGSEQGERGEVVEEEAKKSRRL
jgi:hypothetical protein